MAQIRFRADRHLRQLERQWAEIEDYRQDLVTQFTVGTSARRNERARKRWLELGEAQQGIDAACRRLEDLTRLT